MQDAAAPSVVVAATHSPHPSVDSRWLVIANPAAGQGGPNSRAWRRLERALREAGVVFDLEWTRDRGDGARIAADAASRGRQHFLVAGGDGSLHDVVNGLQRARSADRTPRIAPPPVVVPLPLGTGNDWARSLGLPKDPKALARCVAHGQPRLQDAGRIDLLTRAGDVHDTRWFINVAGAGFDAHVIARMPARTPSRLSYLWGALRELARYRPPTFEIRSVTDVGSAMQTMLAREPRLLAFVANGRFCGSGMHVAPQARLDDGLLDVVTIAALGLRQALPKLARLYTGTLSEDGAVDHHLASRVIVDAEPAAGIEADGQFVGQTPASFTVERGALRTLRCDGSA